MYCDFDSVWALLSRSEWNLGDSSFDKFFLIFVNNRWSILLKPLAPMNILFEFGINRLKIIIAPQKMKLISCIWSRQGDLLHKRITFFPFCYFYRPSWHHYIDHNKNILVFAFGSEEHPCTTMTGCHIRPCNVKNNVWLTSSENQTTNLNFPSAKSIHNSSIQSRIFRYGKCEQRICWAIERCMTSQH